MHKSHAKCVRLGRSGFERANGLDTALYKIPLPFFTQMLAPSVFVCDFGSTQELYTCLFR